MTPEERLSRLEASTQAILEWLNSIDASLGNLENQMDARFTSLESHMDSRFNTLLAANIGMWAATIAIFGIALGILLTR